MKKGHSENIVRVKGFPKLTAEQREELRKLSEMSDDDIDYSDIPQITDFSGFEVGRFYRPIKETVTMRIDADVLHWLRQGGRGYQSRLNSILRKEMTLQTNKQKAA